MVATFDVDKLFSRPLYQSVYAEIPRRFVAGLISRKAKEHVTFDGWDTEEGERVCITGATEELRCSLGHWDIIEFQLIERIMVGRRALDPP